MIASILGYGFLFLSLLVLTTSATVKDPGQSDRMVALGALLAIAGMIGIK